MRPTDHPGGASPLALENATRKEDPSCWKRDTGSGVKMAVIRGRTSARGLRWILKGLLCAGCVACGEASPENLAAPPAVRDSAGIQVLELGELAAPTTWAVTVEPLWVFDDEEQGGLSGIVDVAFVGDDRVAVAEVSRSLVILLDPNGMPLARGGNQGSGPLEFVRIGRIVPLDADSFRVLDAGDGTLMTWSTAGQPLGEIQLPERDPARVLPRRSGGAYLAYRPPSFREVSSVVERDTGRVVAWDGAGNDTIASFAADEYFRTEQVMGAPAYGAQGLLAGDGSGVWIGDTRRPELQFWSDSGLTRIVRWGARPVPMTPEILSEYIDVVVAEVPTEAVPAFRQQMRALPAVDQLPVWEQLVVSSAGDVWISADVTMKLPSPLARNLAARRWVVLDGEGRPRGQVTTPDGFSLFDAGTDRVIGVHRDEFGVESIRAYRLSR